MSASQAVTPQLEVRLIHVELDLVHNTWEYIMAKSGDNITLSALAVANMKGANLLDLDTRVYSTLIEFQRNSRWKAW